MKILQVYPYYPPAEGFGGVTSVVKTIATRLAERGHHSVVYTTDTGGPSGRISPEETPVIRAGVEVYYFRNLSNWLAYAIPLPVPLKFRKMINEHISDFDAVHIHGYPHLLAFLTARAAREQSVPYLLSPHGSVNLPEGVSEGFLRRMFERSVGEFILSNAKTVIALTEDEERRLWEAFPSIQSVKQIPNGIEMEAVSVKEAEAVRFRERHGLEDTVLVMFVGRITYKKGINIIWEVAERFDAMTIEGQPVHFGFVGPDDGMRDELDEYVAEASLGNVSILGYLSEDEKNSALNAADLFILPSYSEGQPISALEACAAGTPVVISEQCSIPEVVQYDAGQVISPTVDELESSLRVLLNDKPLREQCSKNAEEMVNQEFRWESVVEELITHYRYS